MVLVLIKPLKNQNQNLKLLMIINRSIIFIFFLKKERKHKKIVSHLTKLIVCDLEKIPTD